MKCCWFQFFLHQYDFHCFFTAITEVKPEAEPTEERVDSNDDGGELMELQEKAKTYDEKLAKHRYH